jgi:hypothetical protein
MDDERRLWNARSWGMACGFLHGLIAVPLLPILLFFALWRGDAYTLLVVRMDDAPAGTIRASIDGWPLTPRLAGAAGIAFRTELRNRGEVTLALALDGRPYLRTERRVRLRDSSCPLVVRLERDGFVAGPCLWRPVS